MLDTLPDAAPDTASHANEPLLQVRDLNLWYGETHALKDINLEVFPNEIMAFIGPSGCGKTTMLKCFNRMHDFTPDVCIEGEIRLYGTEIHDPQIDPPLYRRRFGWVAQKPNPFLRSIFENIAYAPRLHGLVTGRDALAAHVERCLQKAGLWEEVKDRLHSLSGAELSGGQQQRLCIARALSVNPEVLLMDEPTGSIDPISTARVEELMTSLRGDHSIVVITHSMMEARRIADRVAFFHLGRLLEVGPTEQIFEAARTEEARRFIAGKFG